LRMIKAEKTLEKCVFLLGNSAQTLHPVAAQGFNYAIYETAELAEEIINKTQQQKICCPADLQRVILRTQKQKAASTLVSHQLIKVFSHESFLANVLIQTGMIGLDIAPAVKKKFMSGLLGKIGSVPRLLM
jgi:2-octaprenyl-6-methoxyphenol hydroxylase